MHTEASTTHRVFALSWSLAAAVFGGAACSPQGDPGIGPAGFSDDFQREHLGDEWNNTGGNYAIRDGALKVDGARNKPLWLKRKLPHDVSIEVDAKSDGQDGDIKLEVFGDGVSKAESLSYTATSYVVLFGAWHNTMNVLARMNEHGKDRVVGENYKVVPGQTYHMKIERRGATISFWVDGKKIAALTDSDPLSGSGHDHFGFNNWQTPLTFDNLRIKPL
jgi:hypothetical protein